MPNVGNVAQMQQYSALLEIGLSRVFKDDIPTHKKLYSSWLTEKSAQEFTEDELVMGGFGTVPVKPIGGIFTIDKPFIGSPKNYSIVPYGLGFTAEYELFRWDKYGCFTNMTRKLSRSGTDRKNILAYSLLNNSFSTSDSVYTTHNGEALCETTHQLLRSGTAKNAPAVAAALSYLSLQEAITDFMTLTNEDQIYINLEPAKLICHPSNAWVAETLLMSQYRPDNANMARNTLSAKGLDYDTSPYLTSTTAFWVLADKSRLAESMSFHIGDDWMFRRDFDHSTWNNVFTMYGSFRLAVLHFYGIWGSQGA